MCGPRHGCHNVTRTPRCRRGKVGADLADGSRCPVVLAGTINGERRDLTHSERLRGLTDDICDDCCLSLLLPQPPDLPHVLTSTAFPIFWIYLTVCESLGILPTPLGVCYSVLAGRPKSAKYRIRTLCLPTSRIVLTRKMLHRPNIATRNYQYGETECHLSNWDGMLMLTSFLLLVLFVCKYSFR